jgi:hypothetical protein
MSSCQLNIGSFLSILSAKQLGTKTWSIALAEEIQQHRKLACTEHASRRAILLHGVASLWSNRNNTQHKKSMMQKLINMGCQRQKHSPIPLFFSGCGDQSQAWHIQGNRSTTEL